MSGTLHFFKFCLFAALFSSDGAVEEKARPYQLGYIVQKGTRKTIIGLPLRTDNTEAHRTIPAHWERFYKENILARIPGKTGGDVLAVYTDYEGDHTKPYTLILGCEVDSSEEVPEGLVAWEVPASRYAVFTAKGPYPQGLLDVWQAVWKGDLNRRYTADFEVYAPQFDPQARPEVQVLIAID